MNPPPSSDAPETPPGQPREAAAYRPDSASIIHAVTTRRDRTAAISNREVAQREQIERTNVGLLLHSLHEIADAHIPPAQRRLVQESEVYRAISVLRRFALLYPEVKLEQLLAFCEEETAQDTNPVAHLVDPLQLRHVLTFHTDTPHAAVTIDDYYELDRLIEHGPDAAVAEWFARIGAAGPALPKTAPACLRLVFAHACRTFAPASRLEVLSFESAVLTLRIQGVIGFEDTRLYFSLLKQIAGPGLPGLEGYLQSEEVNHAAVQHRTTANTGAADYFRGLAAGFDHAALPTLEQQVVETANTRSSPPPPPAPAPAAPAPAEPRRGLLSSLRGLGQSIRPRG